MEIRVLLGAEHVLTAANRMQTAVSDFARAVDLLQSENFRHEQVMAESTALVAEARHDERAGLLRAYHVTLDGLGAPPDEWPCIRAKTLVAKTRREQMWKAHVPVTGTQHDPSRGLLHGYCERCRVPWPCVYSPESEFIASVATIAGDNSLTAEQRAAKVAAVLRAQEPNL